MKKIPKYHYVWMMPMRGGHEHFVESRNHVFVASCSSERMARKISRLLNADSDKPDDHRSGLLPGDDIQ